jgi:hypothetical protein
MMISAAGVGDFVGNAVRFDAQLATTRSNEGDKEERRMSAE